MVYDDGEEAICHSMDLDQIAEYMCALFPFAPTQQTNPLRIPGLKTKTYACVESLPTRMGVFVYNPSNHQVKELNHSATRMADRLIFGLCVILVRDEETAKEMTEDANKNRRKLDLGEKFMIVGKYKSRAAIKSFRGLFS